MAADTAILTASPVYAPGTIAVNIALNLLSNSVTFTAIVPRSYTGEAKMCKNVLKWRIFRLQV